MTRSHLAALVVACSMAGAVPASAHVTLEVQQAPANSTYRATFRVPHGCEGAPTIRFTVRLPADVTNAQPMPKPGWTLRTVARAEQPPGEQPPGAGHGAAPQLDEIIWEGGSLPSAWYDEFVIRLRLPDRPGEIIHLPVVQDCPDGAQAAWTEIPQPGHRPTEYRMPAPALRLLPRN